MENEKRLRSEDADTSAYATAYMTASANMTVCASANMTAYASVNVTAYANAKAARQYKAMQQPSHASSVIAVEGEASPIEVRKSSSSRKRYKFNIMSPVIIDKDVIYVDVDNADNCSSPAEKDVKNKRDRTAENRQVQFMTPYDAVTSQQSSRPTPERTIRRVVSLLAKKPTPLSRRELLDEFTVFLQHKQKYRSFILVGNNRGPAYRV
jgi:hypothetical protein